MRWQTTDPLGFEEGLNLYTYVRNNPFYYRDLDGCNAQVLRFTIIVVEIAFGVTVSPVWVPCLVGAAVGAALGWATYEGIHWLDLHLNQVEGNDQPDDKQEEQLAQDNRKKKPRYCGSELGNDPTRRPGEGFEWRGKGGPETGKGRWVKDLDLPTQESLHPDIKHLPPKPPHWDYWGPDYPQGAELNLDGTWNPKGS
jgi:hypothetical protein